MCGTLKISLNLFKMMIFLWVIALGVVCSSALPIGYEAFVLKTGNGASSRSLSSLTKACQALDALPLIGLKPPGYIFNDIFYRLPVYGVSGNFLGSSYSLMFEAPYYPANQTLEIQTGGRKGNLKGVWLGMKPIGYYDGAHNCKDWKSSSPSQTGMALVGNEYKKVKCSQLLSYVCLRPLY